MADHDADHDTTTTRRMMYFRGRLMPSAEANVGLDHQAVLFGFGYFETFRTSGGRPHLWPQHRARLDRACRAAGLAVPDTFLLHDEQRRATAIHGLLASAGQSDAVLRYTIMAGAEGAGPTESLTWRTLPPAAPAEGIVLRVLRLGRDNGEWIPRPKSLNYANALLGRNELRARATDPSDEGLFLSRDGGYVVEATQQTIAWLHRGEWHSPDPYLGGVAGTCLAWVAAIERIRPARAQLAALVAAEAIVVLNSVRGVTPVRAVLGRKDESVREGIRSAAHPRVRALQNEWNEALATTSNSLHSGALNE